MKQIRGIFIVLLIVLVLNSCTYKELSNTNDNLNQNTQEISYEERQLIDLYITVMKAAYNEENGGNSFIAIKLNTLEGLNDTGKKEVLKGFSELSEYIYDFDKIKDDKSKFEFLENGILNRAINGTVLSVSLEEYKKNKAIITGESWFGCLGAVFPSYKANYKNGKWELVLINIAVS